jgi:hypothetical protein
MRHGLGEETDMKPINQSLYAPSISNDIFKFDDAAGYYVVAYVGDISHNAITFGNGTGDEVAIADVAVGNITNNVITFGNGAQDSVFCGYLSSGSITNDKITMGDGFNDQIITYNGDISNDVITLGNGARDYVYTVVGPGSIDNSKITLGNGAGDAVNSAGSISNDVIIFGKGANDQMYINGSSNDTIIMGNGQGDSVNIAPGYGGDHIATGTGQGDSVNVGLHTSADTFGFALGTGVVTGTLANYTTVTGAQQNDQVVVYSIGIGNELGNTLVLKTNVTATNLTEFIQDLGPLQKGTTYVGNDGHDTFIVTETQHGGIGAIDIAGVHTVGTANHVLTLLS